MEQEVFDPSIIPICEECAEQPEKTKICFRCKSEFCSHHASLVDVRACNKCLADFKVTESIETKVTEISNAKGEVISRRMQHATKYTLSGSDWMFTQRAIVDMSDQDLENTIEYHRAAASVMLTEREHRRQEKAHKLSQMKIIVPTRETQYDREEKERKATEKAEKKANGNTKRVSTKSKSGLDMDSILAALTKLSKSGMSIDQIVALTEKK